MASGTGKRVLLGVAVLCAGAVGVGALAWKGVIPIGITRIGSQPLAPGSATSSETEVGDAEKKLARLQDDLKNRLLPALEKLRADHEDIKARLKALGISDSKGLKESFKAQSLGRELAEVVGLIRVTDQKRAACERSIFELESLVRRLKRVTVAERAGLTDQELAEVSQTLKTIDARLDDVTQAPPELNPAQFDALIDDELGANTLEGRIDRQLDARKTRLAALTERSVALKAVAAAADREATDVENLRARLERACRQAQDEDRWPIKVAGRTFDRHGAEEGIARAAQHVQAQKALSHQVGEAIERVDKAAAALTDEIAELGRAREQALADSISPGDDAASARLQELKTRLATLAEQAVLRVNDPLLTEPVPQVEPFDLDSK